jgi:feruloyl-CoA synthase
LTDTSRRLAHPDIERIDRPDGAILLRNRVGLPNAQDGPLPDILDRFDLWRAADGDAVLVSDADGANAATWAQVDRRSDAAAARLKGMGLAAGDVVAVCAGASVDHAVLKLACLKQGCVHAPLSPALAGSDFGRARLGELLKIARPRLILADETPGVVAALAPLARSPIHDLAEHAADSVNARFTRPAHAPGDMAALYFTSGSTGAPKGVAITRRMIASNQAAYALHWPFLARRRPVLLDWLPWHHVFGGLDNFFKTVWNGGEYHVDRPPAPDRVAAMAARLRAVRPTVHINVPFGIALLLDRLDADRETREAFFARLELIFFAGAGMDAPTWARLRDAVAALDDPPVLVSGYGMTEAASTICLGLAPAEATAEIGFPLPGHTLRLVPVDGTAGSWEIRVRGPNVAPHYVAGNDTAPLPLDAEGFLVTGDLARAIHAGAPERGLAFDGRLAEDFKLSTGTRVKTGALRHALLEACAPDLAEIAIAGEGRGHLAAILFARADTSDPAALAARLEAALVRHNEAQPGSSTAIRRAVIAAAPPDRAAGEINDKGHLMQRRTLANRADLVERLYGGHFRNTIVMPNDDA